MVKNLPAMWETWVWSLGWEDPLEEGMATHSNILAWRIPWTEEPGKLQSVGSQRAIHDRTTKHSTYIHIYIYVNICLSVCLSLSIYIYIEREKTKIITEESQSRVHWHFTIMFYRFETLQNEKNIKHCLMACTVSDECNSRCWMPTSSLPLG